MERQRRTLTMQKKSPSKNTVQLVWGIALLLVGVAVFFRVPQVVPKLVELRQSVATISVVRICFYLLGFILIGGGIQKIVRYVRQQGSAAGKRPPIEGENDLDR